MARDLRDPRARVDLGDLAEAYCQWLEQQQGLRFSSVANYVNSLLSVGTHCYATFEVADSVLALDPSPLEQLSSPLVQLARLREPPEAYASLRN